MATRTVRLDAETERVLAEVQRRTGLSASGALKRGLVAARAALRHQAGLTPFEIYRRINLGPGGYARVPARRAKPGVRALLRAKRGR
jgi:hypothetical protein